MRVVRGFGTRYSLFQLSVYLPTHLSTHPTHPPTYPPAYHLPASLPTYQAKLAKMGFMLQQRPVPLDNIYTAAQAQVAYLVSAAPHQPPEPKPDPRPRH